MYVGPLEVIMSVMFGDTSTKTANLATAKMLFNSVVSTPMAWCMIGDLKDFYLDTPMPVADYAYMHIVLHSMIHNGHVYVEICRGM